MVSAPKVPGNLQASKGPGSNTEAPTRSNPAVRAGFFVSYHQLSLTGPPLWYALRMFEERKNMLSRMATTNVGGKSKSLAEREEESELHIERIRAMLKASDEATLDERKSTM